MNSMIKTRKGERGFTLIEIVIVMVILGILAVVAIPKFVDLTSNAKIAAAQGTLGSIRSVLAVTYAQNAANGSAAFPASLGAADFANNAEPMNSLTGQDGVAATGAPASGLTTDATNGFWYDTTTGVAGAYSDGVVDTSTW